MKLVKLDVYSDQKTFVIVVSSEKVMYLSTVSKNDQFNFEQGLAAAVTRYHVRKDHPKIGQLANFVSADFYKGIVVTDDNIQTVPDKTPLWLFIDYCSQHPLIRDMFKFIPA